jgi:hypothetical protein
MLRRVVLVRTDVSEDRSFSIIRASSVSSQLDSVAITVNIVLSSPILVTLMMETLHYSETSVVTKPTRPIPHKKAFIIVTAVNTSNLI